jgi:MFS family permease
LLATTAGTVEQRSRTPVYALMVAEGISQVGNQITNLAIPWFVLATTGSAAKTGLVAFAGLAPTVLASLFGGALVDRVGNKRISIAADLMSGLTVAMVPLLYLTVGLAFWQLLVLAFLGALLDTPGGTARGSMVPDLAERAGIGLERLNSASQVVYSLARIIGPALAGALIALIGTSKVLWVDAASFAISAVLVAAFVSDIRHAPEARGSYLSEAWQGVHLLLHDGVLRAILVAAAVLNFVGTPLFGVVIPVYVKETYGQASDLGLMLAAVGAGAIVGAVLFGSIGAKFSKRQMLIAFFAILSFPYIILIFEPPLPVAMAVMFAEGIGNGGLNPLAITLLQTRTPPEMRARILGATSAIALMAAPLGALLGGSAVAAFGVSAVIVIIVALSLLITLWFALQPALRELDESTPPEPSPEAA